MASSSAANMAKEVRAVEEYEEFDLKGFNEVTARAFVDAAFTEALEATKPVRCTFLVGGGKKVRQKYEPDLGKWLAEQLNKLGFQEDRAASAVAECQKTYKQQHDTDKDLKFLHVFPCVTLGGAGEGETGAAGTQGSGKLLGFSPQVLECASMSVAELMGRMRDNTEGEGGPWLRTFTPTFTQRKALLKYMKEVQLKLDEADGIMSNMQPLEDDLQQLYDTVEAIPDKIERLNVLLEGMLKKGQLTATERVVMLEDLRDKKQMVEEQIDAAKASGKPVEKKLAKLEKQMETLQERIDLVTRISPIRLTCKHAKRMKALRTELTELYKIETNRNLQDMATIKRLYNKDNLQNELKELEDEVLGWFRESLLEADSRALRGM